MRHYLEPTERAWVEEGEDVVVVSWPGGSRLLSYDDEVGTLLSAVRQAITDLLVERPDERAVKRAKDHAYDRGYRQGWDDRKREAERREANQDRESNGRGRTVRTVDTGTKL